MLQAKSSPPACSSSSSRHRAVRARRRVDDVEAASPERRGSGRPPACTGARGGRGAEQQNPGVYGQAQQSGTCSGGPMQQTSKVNPAWPQHFGLPRCVLSGRTRGLIWGGRGSSFGPWPLLPPATLAPVAGRPVPAEGAGATGAGELLAAATVSGAAGGSAGGGGSVGGFAAAAVVAAAAGARLAAAAVSGAAGGSTDGGGSVGGFAAAPAAAAACASGIQQQRACVCSSSQHKSFPLAPQRTGLQHEFHVKSPIQQFALPLAWVCFM
mmetsp:Transcript_74816/g.236428  ORF Transcript_74816/g.236428 Transcript_74816/m.236428 type:complete len:268 (-) Transcript_74816:408-1211(-)